jgi:hypothetical protein
VNLQEEDVAFQLMFVTLGTVVVLHENVTVRTITGNSTDVPIVGEVAFFAGTVQPYRVVVDETGHAQVLLTLCLLTLNSYNQLI